MKKIFFFDIDGTLAIKGVISKGNIEALKKLKEKGYLVFICTGRAPFYAKNMFKDLVSGYVTCNGGYVEYKNQPIYKAIVSSEAIKATMELSNQHNFNYYFESSDYIYVRDRNDSRHLEFANNWGMKDKTIIDDFDPEKIETYIGMIVVNDKKDIPILVEKLSPYFDVQRHQSDYSFDLTLKGVSKAVGIEKLVERLGRDMADTIAFGDGRNDIEMLETVAMGVAMGNAVPEAKAVADFETDRIENDGIVKALKEFRLI